MAKICQSRMSSKKVARQRSSRIFGRNLLRHAVVCLPKSFCWKTNKHYRHFARFRRTNRRTRNAAGTEQEIKIQHTYQHQSSNLTTSKLVKTDMPSYREKRSRIHWMPRKGQSTISSKEISIQKNVFQKLSEKSATTRCSLNTEKKLPEKQINNIGILLPCANLTEHETPLEERSESIKYQDLEQEKRFSHTWIKEICIDRV